MSDLAAVTEFVAVLVYDEGEGRRGVDTHVFAAEHPEIAYQLALAAGREERYGRQFLGLAALEVKEGEVDELGSSQGGDAAELVVPRERLEAFHDPRWAGRPCDPAALEAALREPPLLAELPGLDDVPWDQLTHAYGSARDVPLDLRRLASSDPARRESALWQLEGSVYHQGSLYPATVPAVRFLLMLAREPVLPNRAEVLGLLQIIAEAADADKVRRGWAWRRKHLGHYFGDSAEHLEAADVAVVNSVRDELRRREAEWRHLETDPDPEVRVRAGAVLKAVGVPTSDRHG
jgi:hypothetical protein